MKLGGKHSEETKIKMSLAKKGITPKNISQLSGWNKGMKCPWVTKNKLGIKLTEETKKKVSESCKGRHISNSQKLKQSEYMKKIVLPQRFQRGHTPWNYKGGISKEYKIFRATPEYKEWRKEVFQRDNYECQFCHKRGYIEPHHIRCVSKYPELKLEISNGITLCRKCHAPTIRNEDNFIVLCDWILQLKSNCKEENKMINENIICEAEAD